MTPGTGRNRGQQGPARWLPAPKRVAAPTYEQDQVGAVRQWDERENLFARTDLFRYFGPETPQHQAYYESHPEHHEYDQKLHRLPPLGHVGGVDMPLFDAQFEAVIKIAGEAFVDGEPAPERERVPPERAAAKVKALARLLGADLVGTGPLRQEWVHSTVGRSFGDRPGFEPWGTPVDLTHHTQAIAMGFRMEYDLIQHAPGFPTLLATAKGYGLGAWVSVQLAEYLRLMGYSARAHHLYNYRLLAVPVAVDCGLGELSRAGYLMTRELGLAVRLAVVTTDMPLAHDGPVDLGMQAYCDKCLICAENCPIGAIPSGDKVEFNGIKKWKLDEAKCYRYWYAMGTDCSLCMSTCPWTKPGTAFHQTMAWLASLKGPHQSWMVQADKWFYGKRQAPSRLEYLEAPTR